MERFVKVCRLRRVKILALLHLFLVNVAADCQKPKATETFILSKAALLSNYFPEGGHEVLECAHGYNRVKGSGTTVCTNGQWSDPDLICEENDCGPPKPEPNTRFNISEGTLFRARVKVTCDKGYRLTGSSFRRCYAAGWIGSSKCHIRTCDKPGQVTNGRSSWSSEDRPKYGDTIQYRCNDGYTLVGKEKLECTENGQYDSLPPECKDAATTVLVTSTPPPAEASPSSSVATATAPTDPTTMSSAATAVWYSARGGLRVPNTEGGGAAANTEGGGVAANTEGGATAANTEGGATAANTEGGGAAANTEGGATAANTEGGAAAANTEGGAAAANTEGGATAANTEGGAAAANTEGGATAASLPSTTPLEGLNKEVVDANQHLGTIATIFGSLFLGISVFCFCFFGRKFLLRRKGSYDTREDLKPEPSHFHNL